MHAYSDVWSTGLMTVSDGEFKNHKKHFSNFQLQLRSRSGVGSNLQVGAQCRRQVPAENLWMCPHLSIVPPHEVAQLAA